MYRRDIKLSQLALTSIKKYLNSRLKRLKYFTP